MLVQRLLCVVVTAAVVAVVVIGSVPAVKRGAVGPQVSGRERGWGQVMVKVVRMWVVAVTEGLLLLLLLLLMLLVMLMMEVV